MPLAPHPIGRRPVRPVTRGRLLDIIDRFDVPGSVAERWIGGATWTPNPCRGLFTSAVDECADVIFPESTNSCDPAITQSAFSVYDAFKGSTLDYTAADIEDEPGYRWGTLLSAAFATELISGSVSTDRSLSKSAHAPAIRAFGTAAVPVWYALGVLETDLATQIRGQQGMIHLQPGLLAQAVTEYGLTLNESGQYETPVGNLVVADAGYVDAAAPTGQTASPLTSDWIYASGIVEYQIGETRFVDGGTEWASYTDISKDTRTRFKQANGILVFDPCPVTAILASYNKVLSLA